MREYIEVSFCKIIICISSGDLNTEIIFRNLLFLKPYLGWSLVTQISQMTQIFFFAVY